jgi:aspartate racemase
MQTRRIGLIGGLSWVSSAHYYQILNELAGKEFGDGHAVNTVMVNVDMLEYDHYLYNGEPGKAEAMLVEAAMDAERAGAEIIGLCSNGVHCFFDSIEKKINVPLLHIADATAVDIVSQGLKKVGVLGVKRTMEDDFYRGRLERYGLSIVIPDDEQRTYIHESIFAELTKAQFTEETRTAYLDVIAGLVDKGAEGIILGCTEIPLLINQSHTKTPLFPTLELHCEELFKQSLQAI